MKNVLLFAAVLCGMTSFATTEVKATFASLENGATSGDYKVSGHCISGGTAWSYTDFITVIVKYSGLPSSGKQVIATIHQGSYNNKVGVYADGCVVKGIWNDNEWNNVTGQTLEENGTIVLVFAPTRSSGTTVYNASGTAVYTADGLKDSSSSFGDAINFGAKHDGSMKLSGFSVDAVQILKGAAQASEITTLVAAFEEAIKPAAPKVEPLMLVNFRNGTATGVQTVAVEGWTDETRHSEAAIPVGGTLSVNGISFATSGGSGKLWSNNWRTPTADYAEGTYNDVFGTVHENLIEEIKTSLCSPDLILDANVYKTGFLNGGGAGQTATISGLTVDQKYLVYVGFGLKKGDSDGTDQTHTFKIESSGYSTADSLQYVKVGASGDATSYSDYTVGNTLTASVNGLMLVRMNGITPNSSGNIVFTMPSGRSGFNFLAVAKVNEVATKAELSYEGDVTVSGINKDLVATDNKAEVTLTAGAKVYFDAALQVPTKLICEGSVTLSANEKPSDLTKLDLSGVTGGVVRTWMTEDEKKGVGFNFASKRGPITTGALEEGSAWYNNNDGGSNDEGKNGTDIAMSSDGLTTITWSSANTYDDDASTHGNNSSASMVRGYLDDANGVSITVRNIPFAEYAVIIYASTDDPNNPKLTHKVVNDVNYTYDSTCSDVAKEGTDAWGQGRSSSTVAYGTNAIRVIEQTKGTLTITSPKNTSIKARGCISAIQIVPYSTFVAPTVTIASVTSQCSEDYSSNTITGTIADYDANSWEGDLTARVVVNSTVYESEAIKDNVFTIEVTGLDRETVYRTVLEVGYTEKDVFTAIATKSIALYQGERKFVWIASPFVIQEKTLVNEAQGLTISNPFEDPDYIDLCDSEFTVSISASEAVDAENDAALDGTEQGGVRIAQMSSGLKLQVIDNGVWTDFADAAVDTAYTLTVKFHYNKGEGDEEDATSVIYTLDKATKNATNKTDKLKVTEVFISDGTKLPNDLLGACQLDKAVIVDIEIEPGDEVVGIEADNDVEAQEFAAKLKVGISEAVAAVLTTAEQQEAYRAYFKIIAVKAEDGSYTAQVAFADGVESDIEKDIAEAIDDVVESFNTGAKVEIAAKPGLYYGVKRGESPDKLDVEETTLATSDKVTITITKPDTSKSHFYRIIVSPTPSETK